MGLKPEKTVYEDLTFRITRRQSSGSRYPARFHIRVNRSLGYKNKWEGFDNGVLTLTIDELFDLAEALDDICDHIEDEENSRSKQRL